MTASSNDRRRGSQPVETIDRDAAAESRVRHITEPGAIEAARERGMTYWTRCGLERSPQGRSEGRMVELVNDLPQDVCPICAEVTVTGWVIR